MKPTDFAIYLTSYLSKYLPAQKNVSHNTIKAYRDVFTLLLRYYRDKKGFLPEHISINSIDVSFILTFLDHLENERKCSIRTRNHRLSALHAFFRYLQVETPQRMVQCQQIIAIPFKRHSKSTIKYLSIEDTSALLAQPNFSTINGRRDAVLLSVLYDTGARVQELVDIKVQDLRLDSPAQIRLTGKGRKTRVIPLLDGTVHLLIEYTREHRLNNNIFLDSPLFHNRKGEHLTRSGVRYILAKYVEKARKEKPNLPKHLTPHTFRHSKAMHLLQSGNSMSIIQAILGHADIRSTDIYAKADFEMKKAALEKAAKDKKPTKLPHWQQNNNLMDWLRSL